METEHADNLKACQMSFIGIIIANFTHELKNHLAIIKESSGLQQDIIAMDKKVKDLSTLAQFLRSVDGQVDKSLRLINFLNRFAHRMDTETASFHLNESLDELIELIQRFANQRVITLERDFDRGLQPIHTNPATLQMVVFFLVDEKLANLERKSAITIKTMQTPKGVAVAIVPNGQKAATGDGKVRCPRDVLHIIAQRSGLHIEFGDADEVTTLTFTK